MLANNNGHNTAEGKRCASSIAASCARTQIWACRVGPTEIRPFIFGAVKLSDDDAVVCK
jgi:hypothetical protein